MLPFKVSKGKHIIYGMISDVVARPTYARLGRELIRLGIGIVER
jgi:hypothetical protein